MTLFHTPSVIPDEKKANAHLVKEKEEAEAKAKAVKADVQKKAKDLANTAIIKPAHKVVDKLKGASHDGKKAADKKVKEVKSGGKKKMPRGAAITLIVLGSVTGAAALGVGGFFLTKWLIQKKKELDAKKPLDQRAKEATGKAKDALKGATADAKSAAKDNINNAEKATDKAADKASSGADKAADKASSAADKAADKTSAAVDKAAAQNKQQGGTIAGGPAVKST